VKLNRKIIVLVFIASFLMPFIGTSDNNSVMNTQIVKADAPDTLVQKWNYTAGSYVSGTATLFDMNDDGLTEIIFGTGSSGVSCLNHDGTLNWTYAHPHTVAHSPAIVDIDGDYKPNVMAAIGSNFYYLDENGGFVDSKSMGYTNGAPTVVDIDEDGVWEFLVPATSFTEGIYCLNSDGTTRWNYAIPDGTNSKVMSSPVVADFDGNGVLEIVFGSFSGYLYCINETGDFQWKYNTGGQIWGSPAIADLDENGELEVVVGSLSGSVYCVDENGTLNWSFSAGEAFYSSPTIADIDQDGNLDIVIGSKIDDTSGTLFCIEGLGGTEVWSHDITGGYIFRDNAIADIDNDGELEIVITTTNNMVRVISYTGSIDRSYQYMLSDFTTTAPVIADIDNDGIQEIIVGDGSGVVYCLVPENITPGANDAWHTQGGSMFRTGNRDRDGDHLDDFTEGILGTTNTNNDTDSDSLLDGQEIFLYGTSPINDDTDADLVTDGDEILWFFTNPLESDSDFDGLSDRWEIDLGTDPWDTDTDDDLLTDGEEWNTYGSNPLLADTDSDGLDDWEEVNLGVDGYYTSVDNNDSDNDGILDGSESSYGTSPIDADSDDDGLLDGEEIILGLDGYTTSPTDPDSDDDGLNDGEEYIEGTDPNDSDTDDDGYSDGDEIAAGTDPLDPEDYPITSTPTPTPTPTPTNEGALIGGIVSFALVALMATTMIYLSERRKKYLK